MSPTPCPDGVADPVGTSDDTDDLRHHTYGELLAGLAGAADRRRAHTREAITGDPGLVEEGRRITELEEALVIELRSRPRRPTPGDTTH